MAVRRVVSYGWRYDFSERKVQPAEDIPTWLLSLRDVAAGFAEMDPSRLQQALVTEYDTGATIGWHRDKAVFGDVIGISLLASCRFRLRRKVASPGSASRSRSRRGPPIYCGGRRGPSGSTVFQRWMRCATRSRSEISGGRVRRLLSGAR